MKKIVFISFLLIACFLQVVWSMDFNRWASPIHKRGFSSQGPSRITTSPIAPYGGKEFIYEGAVLSVKSDEVLGKILVVRTKEKGELLFYVNRYTKYEPSSTALKEGSYVKLQADSWRNLRMVTILRQYE